MSDDGTPEPDSALSFDRAEYATEPGDFACAACRTPLSDEYWQIGRAYACTRCKDGFLAARGGESALAVFLRAALLGAAAALAGAVGWWAVTVLAQQSIGLLAIPVGLLIGAAVRRGSGRRGGTRFQALAVLLTAGVSVPFFAGTRNGLGLVIVGFALYEAWKMNRGGALSVAGPFRRRPIVEAQSV